MLVTFIVVISVLIAFSAIYLLVRIMSDKKSKEVLGRFQPGEVLLSSPNANFFGKTSLGMTQVRGNGVLVLTAKELFFEMWIPKREYHIPIFSIKNIKTPKVHLGKTRFKPLLKIVFCNQHGHTDAMAWQVKHLSSWIEALEQLRNNPNNDEVKRTENDDGQK